MRSITVALAIAVALAPLMGEILPLNGLAAVAQEQSEASKQKTRRVPSMSEAIYKKLAEAQELIDAKDFDGAHRVLSTMLDRSKRYNGNEIGQVHNMLGYVAFSGKTTLAQFASTRRSWRKESRFRSVSK